MRAPSMQYNIYYIIQYWLCANLQAGVDKNILRYLTEEHLRYDCDITNGVHRMKILEAAKRKSCSTLSTQQSTYSVGLCVRLFYFDYLDYRPADGILAYSFFYPFPI